MKKYLIYFHNQSSEFSNLSKTYITIDPEYTSPPPKNEVGKMLSIDHNRIAMIFQTK